MGIGIMITAMHPMSVPAHWTPKFRNSCRENKGNVAPTAERRIVFAAKTEAALYNHRYVSMSAYNKECRVILTE